MVIAGADRTTRRRAMRRQRDPSFFRFGSDLRRARERNGLSLDALQDRTGVLRADLERLEEGDLSRFPDERSALVAVRRYAESLGLDAAVMAQNVAQRWPHVTAGAGPGLTGVVAVEALTGAATSSTTVATGHMSRYPGDTSHLRAFTQTAEVPQVGSRSVGVAISNGPRLDTTDALPVTMRAPTPRRRPAPLALRVAVWCTVVLLVLGGAGLAVHHWRPGWLAKIHLVSGPSTAAGRRRAVPSPATTRPAVVSTTSSGPGTATVAVRSSSFTVVVATQAPCWIEVTTPSAFAPVFSATVPGGTTKGFASADGRLSIELGASRVLLSVQVDGASVPGWYFGPPTAPFVLNFQSAPS